MTALGPEGHRKRLRERFLRSGLEGFHDHEVLELLLTFAIPRRDVKPAARALLERFQSLSAVLDATVQELTQVDGVGPHAALLLTLLPRLLERYHQDRWRTVTTLGSTRDAVRYLQGHLEAERKEIFCILALNSQNGLIAVERIQEGTVNRTAVFPRLVVEAALRHRATAVILAHNHPSGEPEPSAADRQLTRKLRRLLGDLDIAVHDHIILAGPRYYSFAERGEMD
ncbi:DNA repair protein RadC [Desulfacinum infernum DSM 9756]|uniref:DNA repair protein RadC n=1 Tax=Desulfacinum infernum DSM 9756 TaxID=1121391 RepID=A0A1M5BIM4_9BACT|nr:DNA repair protein RadC [Desulfacinum infernum]SHF42288.1 DNA repair protein RadC [Desulfacinum infernum DSM 9756]